MSNRKIFQILWLMALGATLLATMLACSLPFFRSSPSSEASIPVSTEAAGALVENVNSVAATAISGGPVSLVVTEEQLTSLAALEMQAMQEQRLKDVQIRLRNDQIIISGNTQVSGIALPVSAALNLYVDAQKNVHAQVLSASAGPIPLPANMVDELTRQLEGFIERTISANAPNLIIETIIIADGYMTISGYIR